MGIGINNQLTWKLHKDMKYFERVTKNTLLNNDNNNNDTNFENHGDSILQNAVIMGHKTWESIPSKHKPLKDCLNIVISKTIKNSGYEIYIYIICVLFIPFILKKNYIKKVLYIYIKISIF